MTTRKGLVLDANILIRAVLGRRVRLLLETYRGFDRLLRSGGNAREYIPWVLSSRGEDTEAGVAVLSQIGTLVHSVDQAL